MKGLISSIVLSASITSSISEPFVNLRFEEANTNSPGMVWHPSGIFPPEGRGPVEDLLPGWHLASGDFSVQQIGFNGHFFGGGGMTILVSREAYEQPDSAWRHAYFRDEFEGDYALAFSLGEDRSFILSQQGEIPADAYLLRYDYFVHHPQVFDVQARMDGMVIPNGGNISAFAGKNVNLEFEFSREPLSGLNINFVGFNGVVFAIPEPGSLSLLGLGGLALGWRMVRRRRLT